MSGPSKAWRLVENDGEAERKEDALPRCDVRAAGNVDTLMLYAVVDNDDAGIILGDGALTPVVEWMITIICSMAEFAAQDTVQPAAVHLYVHQLDPASLPRCPSEGDAEVAFCVVFADTCNECDFLCNS